jgi:hypothetical protein
MNGNGNASTANTATIEGQTARLLNRLAEEHRREQEERERRRREEEEARQRSAASGGSATDADYGAERTPGAERRGGGGRGGQGTGGGFNPASLVGYRKAHQGSNIPHTMNFACSGTLAELDAMDPIKNGVWSSRSYDERRNGERASTWRSLYSTSGVLGPFMGRDASSKLILKGTALISVYNNSPAYVGIFAIGGKVSRPPENVLFEPRVREIVDAFYAGDIKMNGGGGSQSISLICIVPPGTYNTCENTVVFKSMDTAPPTANLSMEASTDLAKLQQTWVNISREKLESGILNKNVGGDSDPNEAMCYLEYGCILWDIIQANWDHVLRKLGEPVEQAIPSSVWPVPLAKALPPDVASTLEPEKANRIVQVRPIPYRIVEKALVLAQEILDTMPYERLEEQQIYAARLCADSWSAVEKRSGAGRSASANDGYVYQIGVTLESWFTVVTELL